MTIETEINLDEFKAFILFEMYYQNISNLEIDEETIKKINDIMDYHFTKVYGSEYNKRIYDIKSQFYKCIVSFE